MSTFGESYKYAKTTTSYEVPGIFAEVPAWSFFRRASKKRCDGSCGIAC